jgi:hypothetical protein
LPGIEIVVQRGEPPPLAGGVLGVRGDQVVQSRARAELFLDVPVEVRVRRRDEGLDLHTLPPLEFF